ncbi:MAG: M48 family metalloprotease [Clostridia bacterium]|nr:M48 family metalloprotease [Clostridia bacterium]
MPIQLNDFIHPSDKKALDVLKAIPGFDLLTKKFMKIIGERMFKISATSSYLKLGPNQMPEIYNILVKVCKKLEINIPELYLELNREPNAYTLGDTDIFIVLTSGLLETMTLEQIETVIAHECGHIIFHHVLYTTIARFILNGAELFVSGLISNTLVTSLEYAFQYWCRCSELSADRIAAYYHSSAEPVIDVMMVFSGATSNLKYKVNEGEFLRQVEQYKALIDNSTYNKTLEFIQYGLIAHPLNAYRAYEVNEFFNKYEIKYLEIDKPHRKFFKHDKDYNLRIRYEYIKPKGIKKLGGLFDKNNLEVIINDITLFIDKNDSKDLQLKKDEYDIKIRNVNSEISHTINLKYDMNLVVSWDSNKQSLSVREEL